MRKLKVRNCMPIAGKEGEEKGKGQHEESPQLA